jgi:hypothetical protein
MRKLQELHEREWISKERERERIGRESKLGDRLSERERNLRERKLGDRLSE